MSLRYFSLCSVLCALHYLLNVPGQNLNRCNPSRLLILPSSLHLRDTAGLVHHGTWKHGVGSGSMVVEAEAEAEGERVDLYPPLPPAKLLCFLVCILCPLYSVYRTQYQYGVASSCPGPVDEVLCSRRQSWSEQISMVPGHCVIAWRTEGAWVATSASSRRHREQKGHTFHNTTDSEFARCIPSYDLIMRPSPSCLSDRGPCRSFAACPCMRQ